MKRHYTIIFGSLLLLTCGALNAQNTIVLDETGVGNLRIETIAVEETTFEESVFSLGRIEANPAKIAAVSSRISGRVVELKVAVGDTVQAGMEVAKVETRQPGNPPPSIPLTSPISGLVTKSEVRLGDPVEPDRSLLELTDLSEVFAVARVPENYAGRIQPGAMAYIRVSAVPGQEFKGTLLRFGTSADVESGTIDAIYSLANTEGKLRAGMRAEFSIVLSRREGVLSVPREALQGDAAGRVVYVKDFDLKNAFIKTPVVVGTINDRFAEIVSGLFPADEVVTKGAYSLGFAGGANTLSLKEALDAAHGHEHAEDGGELTPQQQKEAADKKAAETAGASGAPASGGGNASPFWMIVSGVLFLLLIVSNILGFKKRGQVDAPANVEGEKA
jgi:cobalt-zinc-cadmium efflux system membrane fusion protein